MWLASIEFDSSIFSLCVRWLVLQYFNKNYCTAMCCASLWRDRNAKQSRWWRARMRASAAAQCEIVSARQRDRSQAQWSHGDAAGAEMQRQITWVCGRTTWNLCKDSLLRWKWWRTRCQSECVCFWCRRERERGCVIIIIIENERMNCKTCASRFPPFLVFARFFFQHFLEGEATSDNFILYEVRLRLPASFFTKKSEKGKRKT